MQDALENVSGVTKRGNYGGTAAGAFVIRGFAQEGNFRNGLRDNGFNSLSDFASIERVEVLKGPASVLFGQDEPGGIINLITKQPLSEPYYSVEFTAGNYNFYRPTFDISGPLNAEKTVLYRLNAAYQNSESFRDFVDTERFFIAPVLTWKIGSNTTLDIDFEYLQDDSPFDRGLVILADNSLPLPINRNLNYPLLDDFKQRLYRGGYRFEHRFSDSWLIRNNFFLSSVDRRGFSVNPEGRLIDNRFSPRVFYDERNVTQNYTVQTDLIGKFNTGSIAHQLLLGFDFNRNTFFYQLDNSAQHTASLWTTYQIQNGSLKGFGGGLGFFFAGDRPGDSLNTFELPSYFRTDATIFYKEDAWRALNFRNLFNVEYYETAQNRNIIYPGAPFTVEGTISYTF